MPPARPPALRALLAVAMLALLVPLLPAPATAAPAADGAVAPAARDIEDYADYDGARSCKPKAKKGTVRLQRWLVREFGGSAGPISRACGGSVSEHTEGRALDWTMDAARKADRRAVRAFLDRAFATDKQGNRHALARRMGIMYVIWNDSMWRSYERFDRDPYLSSSCRSTKRCSKTLRHRDHVHVSLSWKGARARTSWYD